MTRKLMLGAAGAVAGFVVVGAGSIAIAYLECYGKELFYLAKFKMREWRAERELHSARRAGF